MIAENSKLKDTCESVLYSEARAKMDKECAAEAANHEMLEELAELIGGRIKNDTEACQKIIGGKPLKGALDKMWEVHRSRTKRGEGGYMSDREALKIALEYYGIPEKQVVPKPAEDSGSGVKSIFDLI